MEVILMSKMLHFMSNQDDNHEDELLQFQEISIKSSKNSNYKDKDQNVSNVLEMSSFNNDVELKNDTGKNSFLEKNIVITGSISSVTTIEIEGQVNGNVDCKNDVLVSGIVTGDINATNVKITLGQIKGNINCKNSIIVDKESVVKGNITGETLECDGRVEGNTKVQAKAIITSNAVIIGDIFASRISIEEGVEIKGRLKIGESNENDDKGHDTQSEI
jgi:cytoskeletal protein CcmA (bactofilin family)